MGEHAWESLLTIGEAGRISGLPASTLRYYESQGLLSPDRVDAGNGYRLYRQQTLYRLSFLKSMKDNQIPLATVRSMLARRSPDAIERGLAGRLASIDAQMRVLERQRAWLTESLLKLRTPEKRGREPRLTERPALAVMDGRQGEYSFVGFALARRGLLNKIRQNGWKAADRLIVRFPLENGRLATSGVIYTFPLDKPAEPGGWSVRNAEKGVRLLVEGPMEGVFGETGKALDWMVAAGLKHRGFVEWSHVLGTSVSPVDDDFRTEVWIPVENETGV